MAWKTQQGTKHKTDCSRVFGNYDETCPRCIELASGSAPRAGWNDFKKKQNAMTLRAVNAHDELVAALKIAKVCLKENRGPSMSEFRIIQGALAKAEGVK